MLGGGREGGNAAASIHDAKAALGRWEEAERLRRNAAADGAKGGKRSSGGNAVGATAAAAAAAAVALRPPMTSMDYQSPMVSDHLETLQRRRKRKKKTGGMLGASLMATASFPRAAAAAAAGAGATAEYDPSPFPSSSLGWTRNEGCYIQQHQQQQQRQQQQQEGREEEGEGGGVGEGFKLPYANTLTLPTGLSSSSSSSYFARARFSSLPPSPRRPQYIEFVPPFSLQGRQGPLALAIECNEEDDEEQQEKEQQLLQQQQQYKQQWQNLQEQQQCHVSRLYHEEEVMDEEVEEGGRLRTFTLQPKGPFGLVSMAVGREGGRERGKEGENKISSRPPWAAAPVEPSLVALSPFFIPQSERYKHHSVPFPPGLPPSLSPSRPAVTKTVPAFLSRRAQEEFGHE